MTQNLARNIIDSVVSSYQVNLAIEIHNLTENYIACFYLSSLGICNAYLNIDHIVGMFFDWPDCFYSGGLGDNRNVSGKHGMKLAIVKTCFGGSAVAQW